MSFDIPICVSESGLPQGSGGARICARPPPHEGEEGIQKLVFSYHCRWKGQSCIHSFLGGDVGSLCFRIYFFISYESKKCINVVFNFNSQATCPHPQCQYDEFKVQVNCLVAKSEDVPKDGWKMPDGTSWPGNLRSDHVGMIQVRHPEPPSIYSVDVLRHTVKHIT